MSNQEKPATEYPAHQNLCRFTDRALGAMNAAKRAAGGEEMIASPSEMIAAGAVYAQLAAAWAPMAVEESERERQTAMFANAVEIPAQESAVSCEAETGG